MLTREDHWEIALAEASQDLRLARPIAGPIAPRSQALASTMGIVRFLTGGYTIDLDRFEIRGPAGPVPVEPQVFNVISFLLANRNRVVTKEELLDRVWESRFVSESALTSRIKAARRAFGDDGTTQGVIATMRFRGYRWVAPVDVIDASAHESMEDDDGSAGDEAVVDPASEPIDPILGREREIRNWVFYVPRQNRVDAQDYSSSVSVK